MNTRYTEGPSLRAPRLHRTVVAIAATVLAVVAQAAPSAAAPARPDQLREAALVTGPTEAFQPIWGIADLGHGLVAGSTRWRHDDGFIWNDTYGPFLWSEHGTARRIEVPPELSTTPSVYTPSGMTPDGGTVVGTVLFRQALISEPWAWTIQTGLTFLELPPDPAFGGEAVAVSNNGRLVAGNVSRQGRLATSQATVWRNGVPQTLPSSQPWSEAHAMSPDGSVIVGAAGPSRSQPQATRWVNGVEQPLSTLDDGVSSSTATFVVNNGSAFGTATLTDDRTVLMRWNQNGAPEVLTPPAGLSVARLSAIDELGTAAGGAFAEKTSCIVTPDPACNWAPFVWTQRDGFTILPENGLEDYYDRSVVEDVSDHGRVVVGELARSIIGPTGERQQGFVWSASSGLLLANDLMAATGQPSRDYHSAGSVSRNGMRVLLTGNPPASPHDTLSVLVDLPPLWSVPIS
ncbi:hypothetical protein [Micromonospora sp. NPDC050200]|uniref:hypothetical protein n=1 Tax=Micromonospora sp. NPDC050200 TaxID=3155664 RepID=UPI0033DF95AE